MSTQIPQVIPIGVDTVFAALGTDQNMQLVTVPASASVSLSGDNCDARSQNVQAQPGIPGSPLIVLLHVKPFAGVAAGAAAAVDMTIQAKGNPTPAPITMHFDFVVGFAPASAGAMKSVALVPIASLPQ